MATVTGEVSRNLCPVGSAVNSSAPGSYAGSTWAWGGWPGSAPAAASATLVTAAWSSTGKAYRMAWTTAGTSLNGDNGLNVVGDLIPGQTYTATITVVCSKSQRLSIQAGNWVLPTSIGSFAGTGSFSAPPAQVVPANTPTTLSVTFTPGPNTTGCKLFVSLVSGTGASVWGVGDYLEASQLVVVTGSTPATYFDGSSPASGGTSYAWQGAANASPAIGIQTYSAADPAAPSPIPYDIDTWLPVTLATDASALTLPLSAADPAAGVTGRRGASPALTAPLTATAGGGTARRGGAGAACTLPLTAAAAAGVANAIALAGPGAAILLPFTQVNGIGVKRASWQAGMTALQLVDFPASGTSVRQGSGVSCLLSLHLSDTQGSKQAVSPGNGADLRLDATAQGAGTRYQWTFQTPTDVDPQPFSPIYPNTLWYAIPYGMTVWQNADGSWQQMRGPNPTRLVGALRIYEGGRLHILSADDIAILSAAGYADNIVLQEMH